MIDRLLAFFGLQRINAGEDDHLSLEELEAHEEQLRYEQSIEMPGILDHGEL